MKNFSFLILVLLIVSSCGSSISHDPKIDQFIGQTEEYVQISNTENLPEEIKPYQAKMINHLGKMEMEPEDCYIWTVYSDSDSEELKIPVRHYDGFVKEYNFEQDKIEMERNRDTTKEGYALMTHLGNWSGKDGHFLIDKSSGKIITYLLWK